MERHAATIVDRLREAVCRAALDAGGRQGLCATLDLDDNCRVPCKEVSKLFRKLGITASQDETRAVIDRLDAVGHGSIDLDELALPESYDEALAWNGGAAEVDKFKNFSQQITNMFKEDATMTALLPGDWGSRVAYSSH